MLHKINEYRHYASSGQLFATILGNQTRDVWPISRQSSGFAVMPSGSIFTTVMPSQAKHPSAACRQSVATDFLVEKLVPARSGAITERCHSYHAVPVNTGRLILILPVLKWFRAELLKVYTKWRSVIPTGAKPGSPADAAFASAGVASRGPRRMPLLHLLGW
jgi:hypothetical protein